MEKRALNVVILAAGKGKRLGGTDQKVAHPLCGRPMISFVLETVRQLLPARIIVVVGFLKEQVKQALVGETVTFVEQSRPLGTGDALLRTRPCLNPVGGNILVLCGDVPFLTADTLRRLIDTHNSSGASCTILTAVVDHPTGYGRILRSADGSAIGIVEELNATPAQKAIREINTGVYLFRADRLFGTLERISPDPVKGEYYLTDAIALFAADGEPIATYTTPTPEEAMGINTPAELEAAEAFLRRRAI